MNNIHHTVTVKNLVTDIRQLTKGGGGGNKHLPKPKPLWSFVLATRHPADGVRDVGKPNRALRMGRESLHHQLMRLSRKVEELSHFGKKVSEKSSKRVTLVFNLRTCLVSVGVLISALERHGCPHEIWFFTRVAERGIPALLGPSTPTFNALQRVESD
ncbi:hypothetical protein ARMGADRAFT_1026957 [Armillaria gallica]|uniref:Uncharacterized protein n=1 Tax=Armillaria gallica TaxID=47427 RepID=A0A2H3DQE0_ARMGA|nr:hypothetical protein ARMGADRAFT_1026957 [Armillaria gallica]